MDSKLVVICDVKHMFIIFIAVGAVAATTFYFINTTTPPLLLLLLPTATNNNVFYDSVDIEGCDFSSGKWVHDNDSYPLYKEVECPYITGEFACQQHGRLDSKYQQWRWQPHDHHATSCNLPRFDAKEVLERLRGKRVIFVGDSVNRNQWVSMVCMLQTVIPLELKQMRKIRHVSLRTFKALEYNVSIDFYWAPFLVESNADHSSKHKTNDPMIRVESIEKHAKYWVNAEVVIFNSYLWWRFPTLKILNGSLEDSTQYDVVSNHHGYGMVMEVWSKWLHDHVNRTRTHLYFMSMTATHHSGKELGMKSDQNCFNETEPTTDDLFWESDSDLKLMTILQSSLNKLKEKGVNVQMVNITQLTQYRKDAHPSIHRMYYSPLTKAQLNNPSSYADCTHWCLPGVPDVWNELLLAYILGRHK